MAAGGKREGAGRPAGSKGPYKKREGKARTKVQTEKVLAAVSSDPKDLPLAFLLATMQDVMVDKKGKPVELSFKQRFEAAVAAAPYVHAKKASVEIKGDEAAPLQVQSDIGQALKTLAEMARSRTGDAMELKTIDLEPATLPDRDSQTDGS